MSSIFDQLTARPDAGEQIPAGDAHSSRADQGSSAEQPDGYTPRRIKEAVLELLKYGLLEEQRKPNLYREVITQREAIGRILEPLDLAMRVDEIRGLAYVVVAGLLFDSVEDEWSHPLVRRQRLNLEQSLLIAILRQQFVAHEQQAGVGSTDAVVSIDDLLPQLQLYLGDLGSDAQEQKRLRNLLDQLKGHGIVSEVDEHDRVAIRPIIAHLANPENLQSLLQAFRSEAGRRKDPERSRDEGGER
jgi:Domain of unknown function (DUF4194)